MFGRRKTAWLVLGVSLFCGSSADAEEPAPLQLEAGGFTFRPIVEARLRGEYRRSPLTDGLPTEKPLLEQGVSESERIPYEDQAILWERARLGLEVERGPVALRVTMQDVRAWGTPSDAAISGQPRLPVTAPYESYLEVHTANRGVVFRAGRQSVTLGDGRLVGASEEGPTGRPLDAARLSAQLGAFDVEALAAILAFPGEVPSPSGVAATPPKLGAGAQLYAVGGGWRPLPYLGLELLGLARIVRQPLPTSLLPSDTFVGSARVFGDHRGLRYSVIGAIEGGRVAIANTPENASLFAGAVAGRVDWETALPWRLTFGAEGAYASGGPGDPSTPEAIHVFDPIAPDVSQAFGRSGFFAWSNLVEASADIAVRPVDELRAQVGYRFAALADPTGPWSTSALAPVGRDPENTDRALGHALVVRLETTPWDPLTIGLDYDLLVLGDGARAIWQSSHPEALPNSTPTFAEYLGLDVRAHLP